jgi:hypothetical protein
MIGLGLYPLSLLYLLRPMLEVLNTDPGPAIRLTAYFVINFDYSARLYLLFFQKAVLMTQFRVTAYGNGRSKST